MSKKKEGTAFGRWYEQNKTDLAARRRKRYKEDPEYRQKAKDNANRSRRRVIEGEPPEQYQYTFDDVAVELGVSVYTLRDWRRRGYFPEPFRHNQRLYFSSAQLALLHDLKEFLSGGGARRPDDLEVMKNTVFMNWEN